MDGQTFAVFFFVFFFFRRLGGLTSFCTLAKIAVTFNGQFYLP